MDGLAIGGEFAGTELDSIDQEVVLPLMVWDPPKEGIAAVVLAEEGPTLEGLVVGTLGLRYEAGLGNRRCNINMMAEVISGDSWQILQESGCG